MAKFILPSEAAIGSYGGVPTNVILEAALTQMLVNSGQSPLTSYRLGGMAIGQGAGQTMSITAGSCSIEGFWCYSDAALTASILSGQNYYAFLVLTFSNGIASDFNVQLNTTGTPPAHSVCLGIFSTNVSGVIPASVRDSVASPRVNAGTFTGDGALSRLIFLGFSPKLVILQCDDYDGASAPLYAFSGLAAGAKGAGIYDGLNVGGTATGRMAICIADESRPDLNAWGFTVAVDGYGVGSNRNGVTYRYLAFA
jgi:hypothetical protein